MEVPCHFTAGRSPVLQPIDFNSFFLLKAFVRRNLPQRGACLFLNETFRRLDETYKKGAVGRGIHWQPKTAPLYLHPSKTIPSCALSQGFVRTRGRPVPSP